MTLIIGALLGFISVAFGAYAEHGLKSGMDAHAFESLTIALRYNQTHAILIAVIGLLKLQNGRLAHLPSFNWAGYFFIAGTVFFCFSIYCSALFASSATSLAPFGGTLLMLGWLSLALTGFCAKRARL